MVIKYCYLEREDDRVLKFHMNDFSYFEKSASFKRHPFITAVP